MSITSKLIIFMIYSNLDYHTEADKESIKNARRFAKRNSHMDKK